MPTRTRIVGWIVPLWTVFVTLSVSPDVLIRCHNTRKGLFLACL
jgi:hypothetical protein